MKKILLSFLFTTSLIAQPTAWLRSGLPNGAEVSTTTGNGVSPMVITTRWAHGLSGGTDIWIHGICGNTAASDKHVKVKTSSPAPTSTTFAVVNPDGSDITGNGDFLYCSGYGYVAKVSLTTLQTSPRFFFDGPNGVRARELALNSSNGLTSLVVNANLATVTLSFPVNVSTGNKIGVKNTGNVNLNGTHTVTVTGAQTYTFPTSSVSNGTYTSGTTISTFFYAGNPGWDQLITDEGIFHGINNTALLYLADPSNTTARDAVLNLLSNLETLLGGNNFIINESQDNGGDPNGVDFGTEAAYAVAKIIEPVKSYIDANWTSGQKQALYDKIFNDAGCTKPQPTLSAGTVVIAGTSVVGTGTSFTAFGSNDYVDFGQPGPNGSSSGSLVNVVTDDTHMTIKAGPFGINGSGSYSTIYHVPGWTTGSCGLLWKLKHHTGHLMSDPVNYPPNGGVLATMTTASNQHTFKMVQLMSLPAVLLDDDPRAITEFSSLYNGFYDRLIAYTTNSITGVNSDGSTYGYDRGNWGDDILMYTINNIFAGAVDIGQNDSSAYKSLDETMYLMLPNAGSSTDCIGNVPAQGFCATRFAASDANGSWCCRPGPFGSRDHQLTISGAYLGRTTNDYKYFYDFLKNKLNFGYTRAFDDEAVIFHDPNVTGIDYTTQPHFYIWNQTTFNKCTALHGTGHNIGQCEPDLNKIHWASRTGWGASDTLLHVQVPDWGHTVGGSTGNNSLWWNVSGDYGQKMLDYVVFNGATGYLLGRDSFPADGVPFNVYDTNNHGNHPYISAVDIDFPFYPLHTLDLPSPEWWNVEVPRSKGTDDKYSYGMIDFSKTYPASIGVTNAERHIAHLKKSGTEEIIAVYEAITLTTPSIIADQLLYPQIGRAGEGNTSTQNLATAPEANETGLVGGLTTKWLDPTAGNLHVYTETGTLNGVGGQTGGYPGGLGNAYRVRFCTGTSSCASNATSFEAVVLHKIFTSGSATLTANLLFTDVNWTVAQTTDKVVVFARGGTTHSSVTAFTTTHSGTAQYLFTGLTAGSYNITVDGVTKFNGSVVDGDNTAYFESTAGLVSVNGSVPTASGINQAGKVTFAGPTVKK